MHLSAPRNRYMHTMASKGRMLRGDRRDQPPLPQAERGLAKQRDGSPFHEVDHVDDARRADHWLVGEDGPHGLFHTELRLQGWQERLYFLPEYGRKNMLTEGIFRSESKDQITGNGSKQ